MQHSHSRTALYRKDKQKFYYFSNLFSTILGGECKNIASQDGKHRMCCARRHNPYNITKEKILVFYIVPFLNLNDVSTKIFIYLCETESVNKLNLK